MNSFRALPLATTVNAYVPSLFAYGCVSVASALVEWVSFYFLLFWLGPPPAALSAFVIATTVNFVLSRHLVFRSTRRYWKEYALVMSMSAVPYVGNFALFYFLYAAADVNVMLAKIVGTCFGFGFNFAIRQFFIFSNVPRFRSATSILKGKFGPLDSSGDGRVLVKSREPEP